MKKLLLLTTALFAACNIFAQSNSIPNPSFENWTSTAYQNPKNCQSSNDQNIQNGFPVNLFKVADPYHGSYAVQMKSIKVGADTLASYFAMGNPGGGGPSGGSPINGTPTGVRLYYKYTIKGPDTAIVILEFKKAGTIIGQYVYSIFDTTSKYLLFSQTFAPALSAAPDSVIIACASSSRVTNNGGGNSSGWAPGSIFQVDSLTLASIATQPKDFDGDFENWQNDTIFNLQGWSGTNNGGNNSGLPIRTTDARSGKYAVELITYNSNCNSCSNPVSYSEITSGKETQCCGPKGGLPYGLTHDTLEFYYKYVAKGNPKDTASVELEFHNFSNQAYFNVYLDTSSSYKKVVYPFTVAGFTPDSVLINIYSSFCTNCWSSGGLPNSDIGSDLKIDSMRFTSQLPINVAPFNPSFCAGSNVKITASGATTYTWAPSSGLSATTGATVTANPFSTTTYTVTGKTGPLTGTQKVIVTVNNLPTINISPPAPTICSGNSVNLTASSTSVSYTWSPSIGLNVTTGAVVSANPSSNQVYTATGTTSAGCSNSNSVTVKVTATPTVSVSSSSLIICGSGSANLTAAGATTYIWKPATGLSATTGFSVVATPTATTTYTVFGTSGTCSDSATIIETVDSPIKLTMKTTNVTCSGLCNGTSSGNVSGGTPPYNYSWSTGASTSSINGICAGTYTLTVNDGLGCAAFGPITVTEPKALIVGTSPVPTSCGQSNGQGIATPTGGTTPYTYSWNTIPVQNTQNASALASGNYTVTVTDSNKCTATGTVSIAASTAPSVSVKVTPGNCGTHNGVATATTTGGTSPYRYSWNNGDTIPTADSLAAGVYIITVTDKNGCSSFKAVTVSDTNGPSLAVNSVTQNKCYGQSMGAISVTASGGKSPYSYSWSNSATTTSISNLSAGPYQITVTDKNGCTVVKTINITAPLAIGLTTATTQAGCGSSNGDASVSASGGTVPYSYLWSTSGTSSSVSNVSAGTYQVVVTDKNGCKDSVDASVSNAAGPVVKITSVTDNNCSTGTMGSISISDSGGTTPYTYSWSNGATTSNITNLNAGVYNITVTDAGGCKGTANTKVTEVQPPAISICMVTVDPPTNHNEIIWNKTATKKIARYNIYKETTSPGVFNKIGSVPVDSQCVYIDSLSNALVRSWRYEISQVDSCGDESPLSLPHKTMHLTISPGVGNQFNLIWDNYQGLTFGYYIIYRDSVPGKASDSVGWITNSGIYTYTDIVPTLTHSWYYHMGIDNPGGCTPAIEAINYNSSKSNTGNVTVSGIPQVDAELNSLEVYPNPTTGMVNMSISLAGEKQNVGIRVINTMGQVLWNSKYNNVSGSLKKQIDLSAYSKGIYIVQVTTDNGVMFRKVVIQ